MKRDNQTQRRIKFDEAYFDLLKKRADMLGVNFYTLTEDVLKNFETFVNNGNENYRMVKPRLDEVLKSIWISNDQMESIIEEFCFLFSASSNIIIYNAFLVYGNSIKDE